MSAPGLEVPGDGASQSEMAEGHLFEISMRSWGVSRVVGDPTYHQDDWSLPPKPVQVRAWSLKGALTKAADLPLRAWFEGYDDEPITDTTPAAVAPKVRIRDMPVRVLVTHADPEEYAQIFNEGYEAACAQNLADDPTFWQDWLDTHDQAVRAEALRDMAAIIAAGPSFPLAPDIITTLIREHADSIEARADQ